MKRRDFIAQSLGALGTAAPIMALAQARPCMPPEFGVDGRAVTNDCSRSLLENAAASIGAGQRTTGLGDTGLGAAELGSIQWANRFHYDHATGRAHLIGKYASSQGGERTNSYYDSGSNTWSTSGRFNIGGGETGHIYESFAYNPVNREIYVGRWNNSYFQRWTSGAPLDQWTQTSAHNTQLSPAGTPVQAPCCWHPNLFGPGDGGLLVICNRGGTDLSLVAWRRSSNSWTTVSGSEHKTTATASITLGAVEYVRASGYAIATFARGNTYRVGAGSGGAPAAAVQFDAPPIDCRYAGAGSNVGMLFDDPTGAGGPYILEKGGSNRVWRYIGGSWSLRNYTHPFPAGSATDDTNWVVASVYPLGVFWAVDNRSSTPSMLWRPND